MSDRLLTPSGLADEPLRLVHRESHSFSGRRVPVIGGPSTGYKFVLVDWWDRYAQALDEDTRAIYTNDYHTIHQRPVELRECLFGLLEGISPMIIHELHLDFDLARTTGAVA